MATTGPKIWDIAGHIHNFVNADAVKEVTDTVVDEIKEVATGGNTLGTTESVQKAAEIVASKFDPSTMCSLQSLLNTTADVCSLKDAPSSLMIVPDTLPSSYVNMALGSLGGLATLGLSGWGLWKLRGSRATAGSLLKSDIYAELQNSPEALHLIDAFKTNKIVITAINTLTVEQVQRLLELEKTTKGTLLAGMAKMKQSAFLVALQEAISPESMLIPELTEKALDSSSNEVVGTSSAPKAALADTILTSEAGKQILVKIRSGEQGKAALENMSAPALKSLEQNAVKYAPKMAQMNDATIAELLKQIAAIAAQEKKKPTLKV